MNFIYPSTNLKKDQDTELGLADFIAVKWTFTLLPNYSTTVTIKESATIADCGFSITAGAVFH